VSSEVGFKTKDTKQSLLIDYDAFDADI